jgi:hypothetical protein
VNTKSGSVSNTPGAAGCLCPPARPASAPRAEAGGAFDRVLGLASGERDAPVQHTPTAGSVRPVAPRPKPAREGSNRGVRGASGKQDLAARSTGRPTGPAPSDRAHSRDQLSEAVGSEDARTVTSRETDQTTKVERPDAPCANPHPDSDTTRSVPIAGEQAGTEPAAAPAAPVDPAGVGCAPNTDEARFPCASALAETLALRPTTGLAPGIAATVQSGPARSRESADVPVSDAPPEPGTVADKAGPVRLPAGLNLASYQQFMRQASRLSTVTEASTANDDRTPVGDASARPVGSPATAPASARTAEAEVSMASSSWLRTGPERGERGRADRIVAGIPDASADQNPAVEASRDSTTSTGDAGRQVSAADAGREARALLAGAVQSRPTKDARAAGSSSPPSGGDGRPGVAEPAIPPARRVEAAETPHSDPVAPQPGAAGQAAAYRRAERNTESGSVFGRFQYRVGEHAAPGGESDFRGDVTSGRRQSGAPSFPGPSAKPATDLPFVGSLLRVSNPVPAGQFGVSSVSQAPVAGQPQAAELPDAPADLGNQLVKGIRLAWKDGTGEARLRLNPEDLGEVLVSIKVTRGEVSATLQSETAGVRAWLEQHAHVLKSALAQQGLHLDDFVVTDERGSRQPRGDGRDEQKRRSDRPAHDSDQPAFELAL